MGDTNFQLMIHDVPTDQVWALSEVLADQGLEVDWDGPTAERGTVHVGTVYTDRETYGDRSKDVAREIIEAAPGATFIAWTDPANEWLGAVVRHVPALGTHEADCDESGEAVFREAEIMRAYRDPAYRGAPLVSLRALLGVAWTEALTGLADERTVTATEPEATS